MKIITIMIGIPGSGKSSYVDKYLNDQQLISSDNIREVIGGNFLTTWAFFNEEDKYRTVSCIDIVAKTSCKAYMERMRPIVIDDLNISKELVTPWLDLADEYGYKKIAIIMKEKLDKCILRRNDFQIEQLTEMHKQFNTLLEDKNFLKRFDSLKFGEAKRNDRHF